MKLLPSLVLTAIASLAALLPVSADKPQTVAAPPGSVGQVLFDGKTLEGWAGLTDHWKVSDGSIIGYTTKWNPLKQNTFLVWTNGTVGDFELHAKYRIVGGNSGIQYRSELMDPATFVVGGYQADIDSTPRYSGILYEERKRGILADRGQQTLVKSVDGKTQVKVAATVSTPEALQHFIHTEDWNDYVIVARGNHVMHFINGHLMSDCVDLDAAKAPVSGILALQIHTGRPMEVRFKDLVLYPLDVKP